MAVTSARLCFDVFSVCAASLVKVSVDSCFFGDISHCSIASASIITFSSPGARCECGEASDWNVDVEQDTETGGISRPSGREKAISPNTFRIFRRYRLLYAKYLKSVSLLCMLVRYPRRFGDAECTCQNDADQFLLERRKYEVRI